MAEVLFSFDVCLFVCHCLCVSVRSETINLFKVKATAFKCDVHVSRDSPDADIVMIIKDIFRVYLSENWMDLDLAKGWEWGKSDPVKLWRDRSRVARKGSKANFFYYCVVVNSTHRFGDFRFIDFH